MKKNILYLLFLVFATTSFGQFSIKLPKVKFVDYLSEERGFFVRYGQFQINFDYDVDSNNALAIVKNPQKHIEKLKKCLNIAKEKNINVIVFPEVSMSLPKNMQKDIISTMEKYSKENDAIIIAGTFYDSLRYCKNVVVMPNGTYYSYKIRPSIFECSPLAKEGMLFSDTLHVFRTKYGNFLPLVCVDLISDDANYMVRNLSNKGLIDMLVNINFNPKSQEFMREASSMTVRHPLFVSLTNVSLFQQSCTLDGDEYGNTSLFGSVNSDFFREKLAKNIPSCYKTEDGKTLQPAYKYMLGIINPEIEGLLVYDINLRIIRTAFEANAPDQGYPTIKNLEVVKLNF
ncbi:MAG: hypothetical protein LBM25_04475 [Bacteroidales bacterium]|jgi:energy-coupling factor transporter ATP-binding protein EcfA2|nr:hypothetical protein [Bacteroidales bacterium]